MITDTDHPILDSIRALPDFPAFEAFAHSLWQHQAAVMVGAGFSRACSRDMSSPIPPLWGDFKREMAAALGYGEENGTDALRLAQEYQTLHGDSGLDQLIRRLVTDNQWEPGPLHRQLMELPWRDVLTTNWDTLLERTEPKTPDRIYSCVKTVQDIPHRPQPRIVKLHGSLPSHKPFIFTEDDYRTYPKNFAPFVNLAQQVMLEHELCLIGFSGVDPNFLAWSGWIRDTLTVSSRRVRLVGVLKLNPVSKSLLEKRNITPIDLAPLVEKLHPEEQHEKALELFFEALLALRPSSPYEWELDLRKFTQPTVDKEEDRPTITEVTKHWEKERSTYPGWIIGPYSKTKRLSYSIVKTQENEEPKESHLRFAMERIWRHRTANIWLNPQDMDNADTYYEAAERHLTRKEKTELCFSVATEWRRFQKWDEWSCWMSRLEKVGTNESNLYYQYETGLRALLEWDDDAVLKAAQAITSDDPIWMMRRASLLATLFRSLEAAELYQAALLRIRQKLLQTPKSAWLMSLEGWAALYHQVSYPALNTGSFSLPREESDETRIRLVAAKADPWDTIIFLDNLTAERIERNREESERWRLSFKSGIYSAGGHNIRSEDRACPFYSLLELMEKTGAPEIIEGSSLFSKRMESAYCAITNCDENDLLTFLSRYRGSEKKILDRILSRKQVARLSDSSVQHLITVIPKRVDNLTRFQNGYGKTNYVAFLLSLLARIILRAPSDIAIAKFNWVIKLLDSTDLWWGAYSACKEVMESSIEALEGDDRQEAVKLSLHLKTPGEVGPLVLENDWPEVFEEFSDNDFINFSITPKDVSQINFLICLARDGDKINRSRALIRLHTLYSANKLNEDQSKELGEAIWRRCDNTGWPSDAQLHPWVFLDLPGSSYANSLFLEKIVGKVANGQVDNNTLVSLRIGIEKANFNIVKPLIISCVRACLEWKPAAEESSISGFFTRKNEVRQETGREIGHTLAKSLLPCLNTDELPVDIAEHLKNPEGFPHIPSLAATAFQVSRLWPEQRSKAFGHIRSAIASREPYRVYPAYIAIDQFIEDTSDASTLPYEVRELLLHACEQRTQPGLSSTLHLLGRMVKKHLLDQESLSRLSTALPHVLHEYRYDQNNLEVPSEAELPTVRKEVHSLSRLLFSHDQCLKEIQVELEKDPLPEVRLNK